MSSLHLKPSFLSFDVPCTRYVDINFPVISRACPRAANKIWELAIAKHVQDIVAGFPRWLFGARDRRREAFAGGLAGREKSALVVSIRDPYDGLKMLVEEDEFEGLVNCLPISAVCRKARKQVATFCGRLVPHIRFNYDLYPFYTLEPLEKGAQPLVLRSLQCLSGTQDLEHAFPQPIKLSINHAGRFKSAEYLAQMASRFFGNKIQRLALSLTLSERDELEAAYPTSIRKLNSFDIWSANAHLSKETALPHDSEGEPATIYMTNDRQLHVLQSFWNNDVIAAGCLVRHLLKIYEIFHASLLVLPDLMYIDIRLETQGMDGTELTNISTAWRESYMAGWYEK